jgi:hypothetical protein
MIFIDYKKALNSVKREEIWKSLAKIGFSAELLGKVKNAYERIINCIKTSKGQSAWFETRLRVRQVSSLLLPILFNIIMNGVCNKINEKIKVTDLNFYLCR